jgi:hypothetical protein
MWFRRKYCTEDVHKNLASGYIYSIAVLKYWINAFLLGKNHNS